MPRVCALLCLALPVLVGCAAPAQAQSSPLRRTSAAWAEVDKLAEDQKLEEASKVVARIRATARARGDDGELAQSIIEEVQLRIALGGWETAVRFLREEKWPQRGLPRVALELYYAHALTTYVRGYGYEVRQREKVASKGALDLKSWTYDQIIEEARRAWQSAWAQRESLGHESLGSLGKYLQPNNYPKEVRGTLRDALSYLAMAELADTSHWRPEESSELYRLPWQTLLDGDPSRSAKVKLDEVALHPLVRALAVLDDLEAWHKAGARPDAMLEARLARLELLRSNYSGESERASTRKHLAALLPAFRGVSWWSMGMAHLATWVSADEEDLVRAREIAIEGRKAYPSSPGGQRCLSIEKGIEAPDFQIAAMQSDAIGKRSVEVRHKNLGKIYFRAYAVDLPKRIESAQDYNLLYSSEELRKLIGASKPIAEWNIALPATPDFKHHRTFVTPKIAQPGLHVIVASARPEFTEEKNRVVAANSIFGDLVIVSRGNGVGGAIVQVLSGESGRPVKGAEVQLWRYDWNRRHQKEATRVTDGDGQVTFAAGPNQGGNHFVLARRGKDLAIDIGGLDLSRTREERDTSSTLVYTDRSVYRPNQKILWKVIAYSGRGAEGGYQVSGRLGMLVVLRDPNGQEVTRVQVTTNDFGSASGEFVVPAGRPLGWWRVETNRGGGAGAVRVEEYKRPTFEVSFRDAKEALRLNRPAMFVGEARYYFGLPVASGQVKWRVVREPVYPFWWGYWGWGGGRGGSETVATGSSPLDTDGTFKVQFTPSADEKAERDLSFSYRVSADLTDEGGETRSAERSFRLGFVSVEAMITAPGGFVPEGVKSELTIKRTNLDGAPRAGQGSYRLYEIAQPAKAALPAEMAVDAPAKAKSKTKARAKPTVETPGDLLRARWDTRFSPEAVIARWKDGAERGKGALRHDDKGEAKLALPPLSPGLYRVRYETIDELGQTFKTWHDLIVGGARTPIALPAILRAEQTSVKVGEAARFLAITGLDGELLFFDVYRRGKLVSRRKLERGSNAIVTVAVAEEDQGGFSVALTTVRDHQLIHQSANVMVPWDNKELELSFATFRDKIRPGAKETFRVTVKGKGDESVAAELLAYMYDRSLDLFATHSPPSPLSLYPHRTGLPWSHASLGNAGMYWLYNRFAEVPHGPSLHGDSLTFYDAYGIGGMGMRGLAGAKAGAASSMRHDAMEGVPPPAPAAPARAKGRAVAAADEESRSELKEVQANKPATATTPAQSGEQQMRTNFTETAFFRPHLIAGKDGTATIEFDVPDSVTSWNVWVHGVTRDLRGGSAHKETRSVKDLMVRPYLPRFFREEDAAALKVVVNNAGDKPLSGQVTIDIVDPVTQKSQRALFGIKQASAPFSVLPGKGANVSFPLVAPKQVGTFAFRVTATAGTMSDGELRPLPVLPSRMHLMQSRFVTLRDAAKRTMTFADLAKNDDPSRIDEQMVVTIDAQLFYTVLKALPYLVDYPYECVEQILNRFVSTGIVSSFYAKYPPIAKMAAEFGKRKTPFETFDTKDPNRKMALEETPWLQEAKGSATPADPGAAREGVLVNVLDPRIAKATRDEALGKLRKAQTSLGAFPWFPGGPPSPYMTLYIMQGLARAAEFKVDVPKDMVQRGWRYLASHFREEYAGRLMKEECCWEVLTFLSYVASSYPDASFTGDALTLDERKKILEFSFKHWRKHSPYLRGMLALTLQRMGRGGDAKRVFDSVMDSAKSAPDQGTFWAQEDRSWLWYNDTIESHAFALRTLMDVDPKNSKMDGLVLWLLLNKKMNQWKSTRATAEVIYTLAHYLSREQSLGIREEAQVAIGARKESLTFEPDQYVGKSQIVVAGREVVLAQSSTITVEKKTKGFMFASATWHFSTTRLPAEGSGDFFVVSRKYFKREQSGKEWLLRPLAEGATIRAGDQIEVQVSLRSKHAAEYVHLRDPRAAGLEPENAVSRWKWDLGIAWYEETRDSGSNFFFERLPAGEYTFKYRLRANMAGTFRVGPATVQSMYAPEFAAYSAGHVLKVE